MTTAAVPVVRLWVINLVGFSVLREHYTDDDKPERWAVFDPWDRVPTPPNGHRPPGLSSWSRY